VNGIPTEVARESGMMSPANPIQGRSAIRHNFACHPGSSCSDRRRLDGFADAGLTSPMEEA
jgi:hypothetical protein